VLIFLLAIDEIDPSSREDAKVNLTRPQRMSLCTLASCEGKVRTSLFALPKSRDSPFGPRPLKSPGLPGDHLKQVMIFHMLNVVGQPDKTAVDVIQSAAIQLEAQLLAADTQSMSARVLAQY
jgi:hypothetical protein